MQLPSTMRRRHRENNSRTLSCLEGTAEALRWAGRDMGWPWGKQEQEKWREKERERADGR